MTYVRDKALALLRLDGLKTQEARDVAFKMYDGPRIEALIRSVIEDCAREAKAVASLNWAKADDVQEKDDEEAECYELAAQAAESIRARIRALATPSPPRPEGPTCASWCGKRELPPDPGTPYIVGIDGLNYDDGKCYRAGRPIHPPQPEKGRP